MAERKVVKDGGGDGTPQQRLDRAIRDGTVQEPNAGNGPYHCNICQKQLKNKDTTKSHLTTQAHMKKENESTFTAKGASYTGHNAQARSVDTGQADELNLAIQNGQVTEVDKGGESYHCKVCNKNLSKGGIRRHLSSQTHKDKLPKIVLEHDGRNIGRTSLEHSQSSGDDDDEPDIVEDAFAENVLQERNDVEGKYWCSVCNQHLKIYNRLENHLLSQKHNKKLPLETTLQRINKTSEEHSQSSGDDDDEPDIVEDAFAENVLQERNDVEGQYWCSVCNQHLKIYNRLANHLLSQKHNNKLPLETTSQRIIKTYEEENSEPSEGEEEEDETDPVNIAFQDGVLVEYKGQDPPYYCNICLQPLKIYGKLSNHLQSKKHKEKVYEHRYASPQDEEISVPKPSKYAYSTDHDLKGHVYVFNILYDRPGAKADSKNIINTFNNLGYEVSLHEDFSKALLLQEIKKIQSDEGLKNVGALILFILCHGENCDTFLSKDGERISLNMIKSHFTNNKCPYLKGKAKIIFANYCRGDDMEADCPFLKRDEQKSTKILTDGEESKISEALNDMIIVHASNEGKYALRRMDYGTIFIQSLCQILSNPKESKLFREVYINLRDKMKKKKGTTPMAVDHVFLGYTF